MNDILQHTIRFFILASIQILVLNNVQISGYINPFVYILFIMLLPPKMPKAIVLILAFVMGFTIDVFSDSYGIHSSATVLLAFLRPKVLALVSVKGGEDLEEIGIKQLKINRFFTYSGILCLIHHFTLFYIEAFRVNEFFDTFLRALYSSFISILMILMIESLRSNQKSR
tara:strand:+ start:2818 stop:3327 length:510 start_codon:yes stop_codon:yes gene_type:complete